MASNRSENVEVLSDGTLIRSEDIGFSPGELLACGKCSRTNSPERQNCIYCGELIGLAVPDLLPTSIENQPESWEPGFNMVLQFDKTRDADPRRGLDQLFDSNTELLTLLRNCGTAVPVGRFASLELAKAAADGTGKNGHKLSVVSDQKLNASQQPVRLRGITFNEDELLLHEFNSSQNIRVLPSDMRLVVQGSLFETKTEETQKKRRRNNSEVEVLQIESDRPVLDLYTTGHERGFRVSIHGFDFSCLEGEKQLLAAANLVQLSNKLIGFSSHLRFDNNYDALRPILDLVWELVTSKDHKGMLRIGLERRGRTTVETRTNEMQFTKYSRLQALSI